MLKLTVDTLEGLDESVAGFYEEVDGSYRLKLDGYDDGKELKGALSKEREARKEAEKKIAEAQRQREEMERKSLEEKEQFKELYEAERSKYSELTQQIQQRDINSALKDVATELTADGNRRDDITALYGRYAQYTDTGVVFQDGGLELTKEALLDKIKKERPYLVDGSKASGGGAAGVISGGATHKKFSESSEAERVEVYKKSPDAYIKWRDSEKKE